MVIIENGLYIVEDETQTSYLSKVDLFSSYKWETRWDTALNLVYFYEHRYGTDMLPVLNNPNHIDYYKAVRTKSRHFKLLREQGIYPMGDIPEDKPKERKAIYVGVDKKLEIKDKSEIPYGVEYIEYSEEKEKLVEEYNQKLEEFEKYKKEMLDKIFKGKKG